jgi:hypothetical protein
VPAFLEDDRLRAGATIRSTSRDKCAVSTPDLYTPDMDGLIHFLQRAFDQP